jgi:methylisocitrate lyase
LVPLGDQLRKIASVMETKRELGSEFFLNARVDAFHVTTGDPKKILDEAIRRGNAYAEAGGDCIFYLNLHSAETIGVVVKEVKARQHSRRTAVAERERVAGLGVAR